jgi:hypothetical protein
VRSGCITGRSVRFAVRETRELDELVACNDAAAGDAALGEAEVTSEANAVVLGGARLEDLLQEHFGCLEARPARRVDADTALQRVQGVALNERGV